MSRTPMYDPMTSDARSSWLAGLTEACNKISGVLDMKTNSFENLSLPELYISQDDRYRIYQAPLGNKLWLQDPAPVIKKNGTVITPEADGFTIDYLGGSIAFEQGSTLTEWDVVTADATYIVDGSNKISGLIEELESIAQEAEKNKGAFETADDLASAYPEGAPGDFAIISSENAIYVWDDTAKEWVNANAKVDLTEYFTKAEMEQLLNEKQDTIIAKTVTTESGDSAQNYFYAGDKTWVNLLDKIRWCSLSGLVTDDATQVEEADTLLQAIGKLQAQINGFIHPLTGTSAPTEETEGKVGQDYINTSNGDKYRMIAVDGDSYVWQKYGTTSVENFTITIPVSAWDEGTCTITDSRIRSGDEYTYLVGPADTSYTAYNESGIHADDVTTEGGMTFHASETPTVEISVDICKMDGSTNGKVYNVGGGGGSSKDAVEIPGGASITVDESIGEGPYDIQFGEDSISVNGTEIAAKGADGKSAYDYAVDGGFTGTEEEFRALMAKAQNLDGGPFLPLSGGTMTGDINIGENSIIAETFQKNSGNLMLYLYANIMFNVVFMRLGYKDKEPAYPLVVRGVENPESPLDAANKRYVDSSIQSAILDSWAKAY